MADGTPVAPSGEEGEAEVPVEDSTSSPKRSRSRRANGASHWEADEIPVPTTEPSSGPSPAAEPPVEAPTADVTAAARGGEIVAPLASPPSATRWRLSFVRVEAGPSTQSINELQCCALDLAGTVVDGVDWSRPVAFDGAMSLSQAEDGSPQLELGCSDLPKTLPVVAVLAFGGPREPTTLLSGYRLQVLDASNGQLVHSYDYPQTTATGATPKSARSSSAEGCVVARLIRNPDDVFDVQPLIRVVLGSTFTDPVVLKDLQLLLPSAGPALRSRLEASFRTVLATKARPHPLPLGVRSFGFGLGWTSSVDWMAVDASALCLSNTGGNLGIISYKHRTGLENALAHHPALLPVHKTDKEVFTLRVGDTPRRCAQIYFVINVFTMGRTIKDVGQQYIRVFNADDFSADYGKEYIRFNIPDSSSERSAKLFAVLFRDPAVYRRFFLLPLDVDADGRYSEETLQSCQQQKLLEPAAPANGARPPAHNANGGSHPSTPRNGEPTEPHSDGGSGRRFLCCPVC